VNARLKFVLITVATVLAVATTTSLGVWQLSRAEQKQARQAAMDTQDAKPPVTTASLRAAADPMALLHQRASLRGSWAPSKTMVFLENRPMAGRVGFVVVMPFILEGGQGALVVQRGWVPRGLDDRTRVPQIDTPTGTVEIEGRMALPPSDLYALGAPTGGAIRQNLALPQFSAETGLQLLPLTLQQTGASPEGLLRDWPVANLGIEKNYGYAAQWFGMAALFTLLYLWFQIVRRFIGRKGRQEDPTPDV
jgi:surfeit locus 1 family protein